MKKIGMEKLIELLNEHFKEKYKNAKRILIYFQGYEERNHGFTMNNEDRVYNGFVAEETIFGKRYGFVKWLVENDKIDRDKILKENGLFRKYFYDLEYVKNYDRLVMWLAVEDEPIDFLISILK